MVIGIFPSFGNHALGRGRDSIGPKPNGFTSDPVIDHNRNRRGFRFSLENLRIGVDRLRIIIGILLVLSGALTLARPPGYDVKISGIEDYQNWVVLRGMATGLFLAAFFAREKARRLVLFIGLCFLAGSLFWTISHARKSTIDVVHVFQIATKQIQSGVNPYACEMPKFYSNDSPLTHKDKATGTPLTFGFVYPLGALFFGAIGNIF